VKGERPRKRKGESQKGHQRKVSPPTGEPQEREPRRQCKTSIAFFEEERKNLALLVEYPKRKTHDSWKTSFSGKGRETHDMGENLNENSRREVLGGGRTKNPKKRKIAKS